jgi:hypothetical protein
VRDLVASIPGRELSAGGASLQRSLRAHQRTQDSQQVLTRI